MMRARYHLAACLLLTLGACTAPEPGVRLDAEAIVVGAGISGLSAAVEMGQSGVNVLVLDMNSVAGGHAVMAGGFAVVDTPLQKRDGFADSAARAYQDWTEWTDDGDPRWIRYYAENSRELIYDWAEELGVEWVRVASGWENSVPRFHFSQRGALDMVLALYRTALTLPNVSFRWNEQVESLLVEEGAVAGVVVRNLRSDTTTTLRAAHVVLATGGVEGHLERVLSSWMPELPEPDRLLIGASIHARGLGHDLAEAAGAALTKMNRHYIYTNGIADPRDPAGQLAITGGNDDSLWVNAQGRRFTNETGFDKRILADLLNQAPATYWAIFDDGGRDAFNMRGREWIHNPTDGHSVIDNPKITHKAQTLEALASMADLPAEALRETVERYNASVDAGVDEDFGRFSSADEAPPKIQAPPFYALQFLPMTRKSMGGVAIDMQGRALNDAGEIVPGLFAVGEINGSAGINGKHGMDGMFLGPAVLTGRVAGRTIAAAQTASDEALPIALTAVEEDPLPDARGWDATFDAKALEVLLADPRDGYWHFETSHGMVLEREYACDLCHSAEVPFVPVNNRQSKLAQSELCVNCHGR